MEYAKQNGYKIIDVSLKIKKPCDIIDIINKNNDIKYKKVIFVISFKNIDKRLINAISLFIKKQTDDYHIINENSYMILCNKILRFSYEYSDKVITNIIRNLINDDYTCAICLEEYKKISSCPDCSCKCCIECLNNILKSNNLKPT